MCLLKFDILFVLESFYITQMENGEIDKDFSDIAQ